MSGILDTAKPLLEITNLFLRYCTWPRASETYFRNIVGEPRRIGTRPVYDDDKDLPRPESLDLANPQDELDFGTLLASWTEQTSVYGTIVKDIFRSKNGKYYYVFYRDSLGRAGISFIETLTEIVLAGREKRVDRFGRSCCADHGI